MAEILDLKDGEYEKVISKDFEKSGTPSECVGNELSPSLITILNVKHTAIDDMKILLDGTIAIKAHPTKGE